MKYRSEGIQGTLFLRMGMPPCLLAFVLVPLLNTGCPLRPESSGQMPGDIKGACKVELRFLEVGEVVMFSFSPNGLWHDSPYLVHSGHMISIMPEGMSNSIDPKALRFMIAGAPFMMGTDSPFKVTNPGQISFRTLHRYMPRSFRGDIEVSISRIR